MKFEIGVTKKAHTGPDMDMDGSPFAALHTQEPVVMLKSAARCLE